ncbi:MAG TPA: bifunctional DNA-formamidopyrimidine glycosylase/DNA-(apurinic or apyrimidinic site) lyase [Patescibacteria group bacterium]|nr:bifunctional DNA-formamidopyrimidine glycosylase/DNA-(apurinic or apyrimidinic site) lyase [Patescibacteria group bacterium]
MPELPEVETVVRQLRKTVVGSKVVKIWHDVPKLLLPSPSFVEKHVQGKSITDVQRRAKLVVFSLSDGCFMIVHLKLTGRLLVRKQEDESDDYVHVVLELDRGGEIRYADIRKFGWLKVVIGKTELQKIFDGYGPEIMSPDFSFEQFYEQTQKSSRPVKPLLMDQTFLAGIGNMYTDESLFRAGVYPKDKASHLTGEQARRLFDSLQAVLQEAISYGGSSIDAYVDTQGQKGRFTSHLRVYGRQGKPCVVCKTHIRKMTYRGRGTHYCPQCQKPSS